MQVASALNTNDYLANPDNWQQVMVEEESKEKDGSAHRGISLVSYTGSARCNSLRSRKCKTKSLYKILSICQCKKANKMKEHKTFKTYIEGFLPEWYISTIYHCRDTLFWSETLDIQPYPPGIQFFHPHVEYAVFLSAVTRSD